MMIFFIKKAMNQVLSDKQISFDDAERLIYSNNLNTLSDLSNIITRRFNGDMVRC